MEIARLYLDAHRSFVDLASALAEDEWSVPVPCTPEWTVRDVLSHVAGVTLDIAAGNIEGAATDPWTAVQVDRWRATPVDELLTRWEEQIEPVAAAIEAFGEVRPPLDCHTHEHDIRHALGRPGNRDSELIAMMVARFGDTVLGRPVSIEFDGGGALSLAGNGEVVHLEGIARFDFARSRLGRRSRRQVVGWPWSSPLTDAELDGWFAFGPSEVDIDE